MKALSMMMSLYATLLPGDVIHDRAPASVDADANRTKLDQLAAAERKRERKRAKRVARGR